MEVNSTEDNTLEDIYQVFVDFFGEDNVDLWRRSDVNSYNNIIVHWPAVTIENEYDESIDITDLYARVPVTSDGYLAERFKLTRSSYNRIQWKYGYLHSHVPRFDSLQNAIKWHECCTGSGPINNTMSKLRYDSATIQNWLLFCVELDKYVHVESVAGTPYYRMTSIGRRSTRDMDVFLNTKPPYFYDGCTDVVIGRIAEYIIKSGKLTYSYNNGCYSFGMSNNDFMILVSNLFIEWVNQHVDTFTPHDKDIILRAQTFQVQFINGKLVSVNTNNITEIATPEETYMFRFKGNDVRLVVNESPSEVQTGIIRILHPDIIGAIAYHILRYINSKYGKSEDKIGATIRSL